MKPAMRAHPSCQLSPVSPFLPRPHLSCLDNEEEQLSDDGTSPQGRRLAEDPGQPYQRQHGVHHAQENHLRRTNERQTNWFTFFFFLPQK